MEEKSIISLFKKYANSRSLKIGHRTSQGICSCIYILHSGHIYTKPLSHVYVAITAHTFNRKGREKKFHLPSNRCDLRKLVSEYVNPYSKLA